MWMTIELRLEMSGYFMAQYMVSAMLLEGDEGVVDIAVWRRQGCRCTPLLAGLGTGEI